MHPLTVEATILYVENLGKSRRFYEQILGFRPRLDAGSYCELELGGIGLGLMPKASLPHFLGERGGRQWSDGAPRCELYLLTDRPSEIIERLHDAGSELISPLVMRPWGDEAAYFEDPDGHIVAVARRTEKFTESNYPWMANGIRPITDADRPEVSRFLTEHWGDPVIVTKGRAHQGDNLPGFIVENQGKIAGLITLRVEGDECEVVSLDSLCEGHGLGTRLLDGAERYALSLGCRSVRLITTNDNTRAIRFYQKRGYCLVALRVGAVDESRRLKPSIPETGEDGIPIRDEVELEKNLEC